MLNRVKLTCFQQHRALEVTLGQGLTAIRGANESGKSTLLRGICYALFGAKSMPDTLENLVTWGEDARKLKAEVEFTADGVVYTVVRGKSGAELNYDGGRVTGQNEVTSFIGRLLRADAVAAPRLMLSNQNEIRGALEAGPKETTALIERLSEFDQIDNLIELIQEKLSLGSTSEVEAAIQQSETLLDNARAAAVAPDDAALHDRVLWAELALQTADLQGTLAQAVLEATTTKHNDGKVAAAEREALNGIISQCETRIDAIDGELASLREVQAPDNGDARLQALRQQLVDEEQRAGHERTSRRIAAIDEELVQLRAIPAVVDAETRIAALRAQAAAGQQFEALQAVYARVKPYIGPRPGALPYEGTFDGTIAELEAELASTAQRATNNDRDAASKRSTAALLRQQITDGSCGFCGQDFSQVEAVKAKNAKLLADAEAHEADAARLEQSAADERREAARLLTIQQASKPVLKVVDVVGDKVSLADGRLPPFLLWEMEDVTGAAPDVGEMLSQIEVLELQQRDYDRAATKIEALAGERARLAPTVPAALGDAVDKAAVSREIAEIERGQRDHARAVGKIEALAGERSALCARLEEARDHLTDAPPVDLPALLAAVEAARDALRPAQAAVQQAQTAVVTAKQARLDAAAAYDRAKAQVAAAQEALKQRREELARLTFNNALLKRVRACRPLIADKLWNLVLAAVSRYFTEMRGTESVVTKGQEGFMVDGHVVSAATLSGSALDILGLAIRVALVKTFLPACPFFVLDEPAQGCDDNRTANLLSFLSSCGFQQVLLVTHEDTSESVANNMITIGA